MARILLVEDDIKFRNLIEGILESEHHSVLPVSNGLEAMKVIESEPFDVVITDLIMPEKEGLELIQEVRATHPSLKIIAMTSGGYGSAASYLSWAKAFGVEQTLMKPFSRDEIVSAISYVLA